MALATKRRRNNGTKTAGIRCPRCKTAKASGVYKTVHGAGTIERLRQCVCGYRFSTTEVISCS